MGQNVNESVASFLVSIKNGDSASGFAFLDSLITQGQVEHFSSMLERIIEWEGVLPQYQLKIRDYFAEFLGFGSVYFAFLRPSYDIFKMVSGASNHYEAQILIADNVVDLVQKGDSQFNQTFIEIDALRETPYIILIPHVLSKRANELESCKIPYSPNSHGQQNKLRYCLTELLKTHYGRKIVNAFKFDSNYPVVGKSEFQKLREILQSFGHDVDSMLVEVTENDWPYFITEKVRAVEQEYVGSAELWLLYRTYQAMIELGSDDNDIQKKALTKIAKAKTKYCNDALVSLAANGTTTLRLEAIKLLEMTHDISKIDYLSSLIPSSEGSVKQTLVRAISALSSAQYFAPREPPATLTKMKVTSQTQKPEVTANYLAALDLLSRSSSTDARIDAVKALSAIRTNGVESHLRQLMNDEDPRVRLAVLDACSDLPKDQAVDIIRLGLQDDDTTVENKALRLFEERWPDSYW